MACLLLAGCGSFELASGVKFPPGVTTTQARVDVLDCKDRARTYANSADKQARAFLLGLTIIGTPVAYAAERSDQRAMFRSCMEGMGYTVREARN
jgi:hypothetical protein